MVPKSLVQPVLALALAAGCGAAPCPEPAAPVAPAGDPVPAINQVLDDWHAAAAAADEERYFGHLTADAIFLGTDATERWDRDAFRAYAHPHFARGRAWTFHPTRRDVIVAGSGGLAWFDEDLDTEGLGPARGSGVMVLQNGRWQIAHYNLAITVPNERFAEVRSLLSSPAPAPAEDPPPPQPE